MNWKNEAICQGDSHDLAYDPRFFELYEEDFDVREEVDSLCGECPVRQQCLLESVRKQATGVHGGIYLDLGHYDRTHNKHKSLAQRRAEEEEVKEIRRRIRQKDV